MRLVACGRRSSDFGVMMTSGRCLAIARLAAQQVEVLRRRREVRDADVALGGELQEALQARRGVLGARALVAVRQQQRQARGLAPLGQAADDELVDDDLRGVAEVAELRLPQHERLGRLGRVAVLEAQAGDLAQRRVVQLERAPARRAAYWIGQIVWPVLASCRTMWRWENVPRSTSWPVRRIGTPSVSSEAKASDSACAQSMPPSAPTRLAAALELLDELGVDGEAVGDAQQLVVERRAGGRRETAVCTSGEGERSSWYSPVACSTVPGVLGGLDLRLEVLVQARELVPDLLALAARPPPG